MSAELTIEQLAAASGMSVRNIRAHQARGLLAPPEVRTRVGYYGPTHVAKLGLIRDLQDDGFNLAGIKRLLEDAEATGDRLARFREALAAAGEAEAPGRLTRSELGRRFQLTPGRAEEALARAERLGILVPAGADAFLVPSPALLAVAERVVGNGVAIEAALAVFERVERDCDRIAQAFVTLFMDEVWAPFQRAGMPAERWGAIDGSVAALRPLAAEVLGAIFAQRMAARIELAVAELTGELSPPAEAE